MEERKHMIDLSNCRMLLYSHRLKIERMFYDWCKEHQAAIVPNNLVAYMHMNGWLNDEKILEDLKKEGKA